MGAKNQFSGQNKAPNIAQKNAKSNPPKKIVKTTPIQVTNVFSPSMLLMFCFSFFLSLGQM